MDDRDLVFASLGCPFTCLNMGPGLLSRGFEGMKGKPREKTGHHVAKGLEVIRLIRERSFTNMSSFGKIHLAKLCST